MKLSKNTLPQLGKLVKLFPRKIINSLGRKHKIQIQSLSLLSPVVTMMFAQRSYAFSFLWMTVFIHALRGHVYWWIEMRMDCGFIIRCFEKNIQ